MQFLSGPALTEKAIITKLIYSKLNNDEKQKALKWRKTLSRWVKYYIDNNLIPTNIKTIDLTKDNSSERPSLKEILDELKISKDHYYRALSISKNEYLELHLKKQPDFCFVNNYFDAGLNLGRKIWT